MNPDPITPHARNRTPYVGAGPEGCLRSAEIDRSELDGLDDSDPRIPGIVASIEAWEAQAARTPAGETAPAHRGPRAGVPYGAPVCPEIPSIRRHDRALRQVQVTTRDALDASARLESALEWFLYGYRDLSLGSARERDLAKRLAAEIRETYGEAAP